ncbi:MAG: dihydroorotate dehydrogenase [Rhodobacter sp.]|nr:dihydroorotate dehydrogenase [Paracoccaceae bacterium]MCB1411013.1 dihydroorotate dehydrogenase [Paracoccaceae bacterium]MCC0079238.1 dihydroorotate dehydrogenase [Rhodobacter sp.]
MSQDKGIDGRIDGFDDADLDALFTEARAASPVPLSDAFHARLQADATAALPGKPATPGLLARLGAMLAAIGGAPGLAGVGAAGLAGVWIGFAAPGPTADLLESFWQGAAGVTPQAAVWAEGSEPALGSGGADLLAVIDSDME